MWRSLSIAKKICSIIVVVALGQGLAMVAVIYLGGWAQTHLSGVSSAVFPAAQQSQAALTAFEQQIQSYKDAVTTKDPNALETAKERGAGALTALESIVKTSGLSEDLKDLARKCSEDLKAYSRRAEMSYGAIAEGRTDRGLDVGELSQRAESARTRLLALGERTSGDLQTEVSSVARASGRQVVISIGVFVWFGVVSMVLIWITFRKFRPLEDMTAVARRISRGDVNQTIAYESGDEIGLLAAAFREMLVYIKDIAQAADAISEGNSNVRLREHSEDDLLSKKFSRVVDTLRRMMDETSRLTQAAKEGRLDARGNPGQFNGGYREIIQGINDTLQEVVGPINDVAGTLEKVAQKDLTVRVDAICKGDLAKIKDALNSATSNLEEAMGQVASGAQQVASASQQISTESQSLSQVASEQAASIEQVSSSLQEMAAMSGQNSASAAEARTLAERTLAAADLGMGSMKRLSEAIDQIKRSSDDTAKIIKTIDELAFQTNLLALNAAVEAARAGDAGKGFAVVAEEVRNLARRSAEAAKNTSGLIQQSVQSAQGGVAINEEVQKNLQDITTHINKISQVMMEIAAASEQQNQGVEQISTAIVEMNKAVQAAAASAEETASAAEELASQAELTQGMIEQFRFGVVQGSSDWGSESISRRPSELSKPNNGKRKSLPAPFRSGEFDRLAGTSLDPASSAALQEF